MSGPVSSGGAAAAGGFNFQHRVTAWVAAHILAERVASPPWGLSADTTLEWLRCETEQPVDDLLVGTSGNGLIFVQIKRSLSLSKRENSDLASSLGQFVRQFIACRNKTGGPNPTDRPLDPATDRLILVTSSHNYGPIREHLPSVLDRLRNLTPGQAIDEAATNANEDRALSVVREHLRRSWQTLMNSEPSDEELRQLLSLIHVQVLDVSDGGAGEREAKNLLRNAVLRNPDQADQAWSTLVELCARYAANRSEADRIGLQQALLDAGFDLRALRSYEEDIRKLRYHSYQTLEALAHLAYIQIDLTKVKIRRACTEALKQTAEEQSLLVVGEPGAGKSGALHDFVESLKEAGRDYIFLAVDRLAARSLGELREELGLEHEFLDVLKNWPGQQPAFLVIDALDAARGEATGDMIRDLIRQVVETNGRWQVVASIRKFDLRYGVELQQLFAGDPLTEFIDPEFQQVRHLNVPRLSDAELDQVGSQSPRLLELINEAPAEFRELLRVPFNLRLLAELLSSGVSVKQLTPITTQTELLDRYWLYRVLRSDGQGDTREAILREVCEEMVRSRTLRVDRSVVARPDTSALLNDLFSQQILVEWQPSPEERPERYILAFSHHVLFDYAVARLLFRGETENLIEWLTNKPDIVIFARPSLVLHFNHLWHRDEERRSFWEIVFRVIRADRIPKISKIIGPTVAAELARTMADLEHLCIVLEADDGETQEVAERALRHLVGALLAQEDVGNLVGPDAGPWCELLDRMSERSLRKSVAHTVRVLLTTLCEHLENFTPAQKEAVGRAARRLLKFAWSQEPRDRWLVVHALQSVCRTFDSDSQASASLIRRTIEPQHLSRYGFEELPRLAWEIRRIIPFDPDLVADVYRSAFTHREESDEPTPVGTSRIFRMISTRRQDYESALYALTEAFPEFLRSAPEKATRALMTVMQAYVEKEHPPTSSEWREQTFDFNGQVAYLQEDLSFIWDAGDVYSYHDPVKMLNAFQDFLEELAAQEDKRNELRSVIEVIVAENRLAVVWRRLLIAGSRYPQTLGMEILPLAWAHPVLTCLDTTVAAGEYLKAIFPLLEPGERQKIEKAILHIPEGIPQDQRKEAERTRDRLLGCLAIDSIITDEARQRLQELEAQNAIPPNEPFFKIGTTEILPYEEEEYLKEQGVPIEAEPNRRILELERPLKAFKDQHGSTVPPLEEALAILPALRALHEALERADIDGVHPRQQDHAWGILAEACAHIARIKNLSCREELGSFVKDILLKASRYPQPVYDSQFDAQFDEHPSWGRAARIEAAEGLITLAYESDCVTSEVLETIEKLSGDAVPAVRFQIAARLHLLYRTAPALMWRIMEQMAREEKSRGVLQGLLAGPLNRLAKVDPDRVVGLTVAILKRIDKGPGADEVREHCIRILTELYVRQDHPQSREIINQIISNPADYPAEAGHVLVELHDALVYGPTDRPDTWADAIRHRALDILKRLLSSARNSLQELETRLEGTPPDQWSETDREIARSLFQLIERITRVVYYASGASEARRQGQRDITPQSKRFYQEAEAVFDELAETALPEVVHYLLEILEYFIPLDPRKIFLRIHHVVLLAQKEGYQYESLAVDLIVRIVERYLAEYRTLLQEDDDCRKALIDILDVFVEVGWPSARRLAYRLEEIYR